MIIKTSLPMCLMALFCAVTGKADTTNANSKLDAAISISIAIPQHGTERAVEHRGNDSHFHVIVSNVSDQPRRLWREWCSWGYSALSFEFRDQAGKTWVVSKKPKAWSKNYPDFWTIEAHENLVLDVYFEDANVWDGFPHPQGIGEKFTVRAVFESSPDDSSRKYSIWTGRVVSKAETYNFPN